MRIRALMIWGPMLLRWFMRLPLRYRFMLAGAAFGVAGRRLRRLIVGHA